MSELLLRLDIMVKMFGFQFKTAVQVGLLTETAKHRRLYARKVFRLASLYYSSIYPCCLWTDVCSIPIERPHFANRNDQQPLPATLLMYYPSNDDDKGWRSILHTYYIHRAREVGFLFAGSRTLLGDNLSVA
jgi:hypothetical protein